MSEEDPHRLEAEDDEIAQPDDQLALENRERMLRQEGLSRLYPASIGAAAFGDGTAIKTQLNGPGNGRIYHADGDIHFGGPPDERPAPIPLNQDELTRLTRRYIVSTEALSTLLDATRPGRVQALIGPPGTGRTTVALAALTRFGTDAQVAILDGADPRRLRPSDLKPMTGYLLNPGDADWTRGKTQVVFQHLVHLATQTNSTFVVLLDERALLTPGQRTQFAIHVPPPAPHVFERCLAFGLRDRGIELAETQARHWAGHVRMREELNTVTRPSDAQALAALILSRVRHGRAPDEVIAEVCAERPWRLRGQAEKLLAPDQGTNAPGTPWEAAKEAKARLYRLSFLLALAVLDGKPMVTITTAALALADDVEAVRDGSDAPQSTWSAFDETLTGWLDYAEAENDHQRDGTERRIRMRVPALIPMLLDVAWHNHPTLRTPLTTWLERLTQDRNPEIRMAAAQAIGKLATYDYSAIESHFFRPWVSSYRIGAHRLAAWALETAAQEPRCTERVRMLLNAWARGTLAQRSVAVRAYATSLGLRYVGDTLIGLRRIAPSTRADLRAEVARAMAELSRGGLHREIVGELAQWARSENDGVRTVAVEAMRRLAVIAPDREPDQLLLLGMLAAGDRAVRTQIIDLWRNALADKKGRAWSALARWVRQVELEPSLVAPVGHLLNRLGSEPWLRERLFFYLKWWRSQAGSTQTFDNLLAYL
ncbi:hypothetical protein Acor_34900 [Acrocarpospora corrugata]|uniref:Uncharacterized protein n=1 Tax=Acrocarpospora corrugata TaxID=35763 RepID=A0A5M3VY18_9ACTN|nr:hypothetical protein [Acrocarpospora corrugata]GES01426.1 hypothetical protein Acor_34900 [Acrocarpospora corrugata]